MSEKTITLHHPTLPSAVEVFESDVSEWVESGWLKSEPKVVREKPADPFE